MSTTLSSSRKPNWFPLWAVIRSVGLALLLVRIQGREESPKVLFKKSRILALVRCGVHVLPAAVSTIIISINLKRYFIGSDLEGARNSDNTKLGAIQIAAKTQELLIVSSMTVMIFHALRVELVFGDGVPLGLLGSGWSFTQLSYFWSVEFWGGVLYSPSSTRRWRKALLLFLLVFGCLTALLAGPAVAILMVPRHINLPAGGAVFWIKGGTNQLWPSILNPNSTGHDRCSQDGDFDPLCPGGAYYQLQSHYNQTYNQLSDSITRFSIEDKMMNKMMYTTNFARDELDTWSFTAHMATAMLHDTMVGRYHRALAHLATSRPTDYPRPSSFQSSREQSFKVETKIPLVRASCVAESSTVSLVNTTIPLRFPILPEFDIVDMTETTILDRSSKVDVQTFAWDTLTYRGYRSSIPLAAGPGYDPQLMVIPVPLSTAGAASLGLVVLRLQDSASANSTHFGLYSAATCSIDARWATGLSIIQSDSDMKVHATEETHPRNPIHSAPSFASLPKWTAMGDLDFRPPNDGSLSRALITPGWFNLLSPLLRRVPFAHGIDPASNQLVVLNTTTMETLLWEVLGPGRPFEEFQKKGSSRARLKSMEEVMSVFVADGLSRQGLWLNSERLEEIVPGLDQKLLSPSLFDELMQTMVRLDDPLETFARPRGLTDDNAVRLVMRAYFGGWAIVAQDGFDYFSLGLLLVHMLLALLHTAWVLFHAETSDAWDSVPELVALAFKSKPPVDDVLSDTSAGIRTLRTMRSMVYVETCEVTRRTAGASKELRFGFQETKGGGRDKTRIPKIGEHY